jgi:hypothetical protein
MKKRRVLVHRTWFMRAIALTAGNVDIKVEEALSKDDHFQPTQHVSVPLIINFTL